MSFTEIIKNSKIILTEGALVERIKAEFKVELDKHINHAGLIYSHPIILEELYKQYIDVAQQHNLPIMLMTPTRKVNYESVSKSGFNHQNIIADACKMLLSTKLSYKEFHPNILIGDLLGCRGDAYSGENFMSIDDSYHFHKKQTIQFSKQKIDFLFAGIMPEIEEAIGMAQAMAITELPYIISFMIRKDGCLLDGTSIADAIKLIDRIVAPNPLCYMANCIHPANLKSALTHEKNSNRPELTRFKGIQANTSSLSPEELNNCSILLQEDFDTMITEMQWLHQNYNLNILGGCCGTNQKFIEELSKKMEL